MMKLLSITLIAVALSGCASLLNSDNPYPGSGGLYFGTPSEADINSGRSVFDENKFSSFKIGITTKRQIVAQLGKPANWNTNPDNTSELGYGFVEKQPYLFRLVQEARFTFDQNFILINMSLPNFGK